MYIEMKINTPQKECRQYQVHKTLLALTLLAMKEFQRWHNRLYVSKFKSNVYLFLQGLSCRVLSVPGKKIRFPTVICFQIEFITHELCSYRFDFM